MKEPGRRLLIILAITAAVEAAIAIVVKLGPAFEPVARPVYVVVAAIGAVTMWRAAGRRRESDRRLAERRRSPE